MSDDLDWMLRQDPAHVGDLLTRTGIALGMSHGEMGKALGISRRSYSRWAREGIRLPRESAAELAALVHAKDSSLASALAALVGETLVTLGLESPPPPPAPFAPPSPPPPPSPKLIDVVVCATAEALDTSPRAVRPALLAAVRCARELGLTLETMETMLGATKA